MSASVTKTTRLSGPERREQILDATKGLVGERGFHGVSIDAVARAAGISRPVVYGHFDDLAGLLHALVEREGSRALAQLMELVPRPDPDRAPRAILVDGLRAFLEAVSADPVTWRLVLMPPEGTPEVLRDRALLVRRQVTDRLAAVVPAVLAHSGEPDPPDPELLALTMQSISEEAARLLLEDPAAYPIDRLAAHAEWFLERFGVRG